MCTEGALTKASEVTESGTLEHAENVRKDAKAYDPTCLENQSLGCPHGIDPPHVKSVETNLT